MMRRWPLTPTLSPKGRGIYSLSLWEWAGVWAGGVSILPIAKHIHPTKPA